MNKEKYTIVIEKDDEYYIGSFVELPNVFTQGGTVDEVLDNLRECFQWHLEGVI